MCDADLIQGKCYDKRPGEPCCWPVVYEESVPWESPWYPWDAETIGKTYLDNPLKRGIE